MFDRYTQKRAEGRNGKSLALGSVVVHLALGVGLAIAGWWEIHELSRPNRGVAMAASIQSSSGGAQRKASTKLKRKVKLVRESRQPNKRQATKAELANAGSPESEGSDTGDGVGDLLGQGAGLGLGVVGALCLDPTRCQAELPTLALPEKVEAIRTLPPTVLSQLVRVAGNPQIQPPTPTQSAMRRLHQTRIVAVVKMCLDRDGKVSQQRIVKSSEYKEYDAKLLSNIRRWKYQPYRANGRAVPICTHVTFIYQQEE